MSIQDVTRIISTPQDNMSLSEDDLNSLINEYPFASALYAMRSRAQIDAGGLEKADLIKASARFRTGESFINHCFALNGNIIEDPNTAATIEEADPQQEELIDNQKESELPSIIEQTSERTHVSSLAVAPQTTASQAVHIDKEQEDNLNPKSGEVIESSLEGKQTILDLEHLSDYGAWLMQLKGQQPRTPSDDLEAERVEAIEPRLDASTIEKVEGEYTAAASKSPKKLDLSSQLNQEIASESLANLLAEQGYHKKAIDMYKKLSLILPEKSTYFATQIEKIKGK